MSNRRFTRFVLVGAGAFVVDAAVTVLVHMAIAQPSLARLLGFCVAVTFTYFLNRTFTFEADVAASIGEWLRYVGSQLPASAVNLSVSIGAISWFGPDSALIVAAVALGACTGLMMNYLLARRVFRSTR